MASRPDIVVFIDWYLPAYQAGGPIRSCANMVAHLQEEFNFHIICSDRDYLDEHPLPDIVTDRWVQGEHGESIIYLSPLARRVKNYRRMIKEVAPHHVYINGLFSQEFSILPLRAARAENVAVTLSARGMLKPSALRIKALKKKVFLAFANWSGFYRKVRWQATDEVEAEDIRRTIGRDAEVIVAPNLPRTMPSHERRIKDKPSGRLKMVYAGRIAPEKNLLFALRILADMDTDGLSLDIHGATYDEQYGIDCVEVIEAICRRIPIQMHGGSTPDQTLEALSRADVLFLPSRGENFGHAILESMMMGTPVIISDTTPWRGLGSAGVGADIDLADKRLFQETILRFRDMEPTEFEQMCERARARAVAYCSDPEVIRLNKALFSADG